MPAVLGEIVLHGGGARRLSTTILSGLFHWLRKASAAAQAHQEDADGLGIILLRRLQNAFKWWGRSGAGCPAQLAAASMMTAPGPLCCALLCLCAHQVQGSPPLAVGAVDVLPTAALKQRLQAASERQWAVG